MESIVIDRRKTFFHNDFLNDYYNTQKFEELRTYAPKIEEVATAIEGRKNFSQKKRSTLVSVLKEQYQEAQIQLSGLLAENINSLEKTNTYTITTGQQIHLGLGPLYVIYKAFDTIAIANELSQKHPDCNFVPVFWMATEDHDLEEIAEIDVFGNKVKWTTDQVGPVGRMNTVGIAELFDQILEEYNFSEDQKTFLAKCSKIYSTSQNLSIAFRRLLHQYTKDCGLVILDADDAELKESFKEVMSDELQFKNFEALTKSTQKLEELGYAKQLNIRECNLFDMSTGDRKKITKNIGAVAAASREIDFYNLSPNAALRPFYQEWILPNLVYVGGPSEIKYWLQLKGIFDNYSFPMPLLHLRKSNIILPERIKKTYSSEDLGRLFQQKSEITTHYSNELSKLNQEFDNLFKSISEGLTNYSELAAQSFKGFNLDGKVSKIKPKLVELEALVKAELVNKGEQNSKLNKLLKLRDRYFNKESVQERNDHLLAHPALLAVEAKMINSHFGFKYSQKIDLLFV